MSTIKIKPNQDIIENIDNISVKDGHAIGDIIGSLIELFVFRSIQAGVNKNDLLTIVGKVFDIHESTTKNVLH
jgi:hypothetical protein